MKMNFEEVVAIIKAERDYQQLLEDVEGSHIVSSINMGGILTAIRLNLSKAEESWYGEKEPYSDTTNYLRKIAALCVKAGEMYKLTER